MSGAEAPQIAVEPKSGRFESLEDAVRGGGGVVVDQGEAEALVWADPHRAEELPRFLEAMDGVRWVGLPFAGIEPYVPYLDQDRVWTCARAVYARPVAEHALMLGLAGLCAVAYHVVNEEAVDVQAVADYRHTDRNKVGNAVVAA